MTLLDKVIEILHFVNRLSNNNGDDHNNGHVSTRVRSPSDIDVTQPLDVALSQSSANQNPGARKKVLKNLIIWSITTILLVSAVLGVLRTMNVKWGFLFKVASDESILEEKQE